MAGEADIWQPRTILELSPDTKRITEGFTAVDGQTLFTLNDFAYVLGTGALQIFKNGMYLNPGVDWGESTETKFSTVAPCVAGDKIVAVGYAGITGTVDVRDTDIFIANNQAVRDYAGTENTLYVQGSVAFGDGGEAFFKKITGAAIGFYVDDDSHIIRPTGGDGSTGWVRSYDNITTDSLAELRLLDPTNVGLKKVVFVKGYYTAGDEGGGQFYWNPTSTDTDDNGVTIKVTALATGRWKRMHDSGHVNVRWFGAKGDDINNDTSAIQTAIDFFPVDPVNTEAAGTIFFPKGIFRVVSQLTLTGSGMHLVGENLSVAKINFMPTANGTCIFWEHATKTLARNSIRKLHIYSDDTTYVKVGINIGDVSFYTLEEVAVRTFYDTTNSSIALKINGRDTAKYNQLLLQADRCIVVGAINPAHTGLIIGIDHHNFHDLYMLSGANHPLIEFEDGLIVTDISFTGYQAWVGGTYGLYWVDTTTVGSGLLLALENVRQEGATNEMLHIEHNNTLQTLALRNCRSPHGIYLRNVIKVLLDSFFYSAASGVALDIDASVKGITATNCFWQSGSTANIAGQKTTFASPKNPTTGALPPNFIFDEETNGAVKTQVGVAIESYTITLADNASALLPGAWSSMVFVTDTLNTAAQFVTKALTGSTFEVSDWAGKYSDTVGTAASTNIYYSAGQYHIENKNGGSVTYSITVIGN